MKEKTADIEGHRIKVGLDQHKSTSSSTSGKVSLPAESAIRNSSGNKEGPGKNPLFVVNNNNQSNNSASSSNSNATSNNNNFDDDYNEWDISIGDLIIDLDADIERQSEGDKSSVDCATKSDSTKARLEGAKTVSPPNPNLFLDLSDQVSVMSSNLKSNRLSSLSSGASASAHSSLSASSSLTASATSNATNTNGTTATTSGSSHHHGHNQRNAYSVSGNSTVTANSSTKNSLVEHHATVEKGLKMKIKRKSIGGKISETKHEIVSSDISPQACKPYIGPFDQNSSSNNSVSTIAKNNVSDTNHGPNSTSNSSNSVITANNSEGVVQSSLGDMSVLSTSKSSKHSNKNKSAHRDKKDKNKLDKDKISSPVTCPIKARPTEEIQASVAPTPSTSSSSSQPGIPNLTLKYSSTLSPSVILRQEENTSNISNPKKIKPDNIDDNISERRTVGTSTSISTITEPDCLGPCEPGTNVTLEGIVWQETEGGVLVVNVTWRGKTYVGTLLDCTKHDWAPPRFCESPTSDIESKSLKNTRGKRGRNSFVSDSSIDTRSVTSKLRNGKGRRTANSGYVPPSPAKSDSSVNTSTKRKGRPSDLEISLDDASKRNRVSKPDTQDAPAVTPTSPVLIECPEPNCSKKYKHINGLKYHQSHAHIGSTFNINDSQDFDNVNSEPILGSAKEETSDGELNDASMTELGVKDSSNNSDKVTANNIEVKIKVDSSDSSATTDKTVNNTPNPNDSQSVETKKLINNSAIDQLVAESDTNQVNDESVEMFDLSTNTAHTESVPAASNATSDDKHKVIDSDSAITDLPGVLGAENNRDSVNISRNVIFSSNGIDLSSGIDKPTDSAKAKLAPTVPATSNKPAQINAQNTNSNNKKADGDEEIQNVASPAYSDISDDTNDNPNELASLATAQSLDKIGPTSADLKKSQAPNNFNLGSFPTYPFNQSQFLPSNSAGDLKAPDHVATKPPIENTESSTAELTAASAGDKSQNPYTPYNFSFKYNPIAPHDSKNTFEAHSKPISGINNTLHPHSTTSPTNANKPESDLFHKDKSSESTKVVSKENNDYNASKPPIVELQNLKNRIQSNFSFEQGPPPFEPQKRFVPETEKERPKEKTKHSPQQPKVSNVKEEKDRGSVAVKVEEGVKPTMETTGPPPPPTNGYYYNTAFLSNLPHSFSPMHFDMFRNNAAMNPMAMGAPYGHPPGSALFHSQMRFPPMGSLEGLTMANVARSSAQSPSSAPSSTATTLAKSSSHHSSPYNPNSKPDRTILSPTSNSNNVPPSSHLINSPASYHKSPSKEFSSSMNPPSGHLPVSSVADQRTVMTGPSHSLHQPPRHSLHPAPHLGFPMFGVDYSAMMANHAANSLPMHPFTPK